MVGSIGVVTLHVEQSRALDRAGLTPTLITAGGRKVERSSLVPLSDPGRQAMQREVDAFYGVFCDTVAKNRGMSAAAVRATEAGVFIGADSMKAGLADAIGTLDDAMARCPTKPGAVPPFPFGGSAPRQVPAAYVPAPRTPTAAEVRAGQVAACTEAWGKGGRKAAASMSFPVDVMEQVGAAMQKATDATWGAVLTDFRGPRDAA